MIDLVIYWTGAVVWALIGLFLLRVLYDVARNYHLASDFVDWQYAMCKAENKKPKKWAALKLLAHYTFMEDLRGARWEGPAGYWRGYKDWAVTTPAPAVKQPEGPTPD